MNVHCLRLSVTEAGDGAAGAFPWGALGHHALFAESAFTIGDEAPADYALSADLAIPAGAAPPPDYALAVDAHPVTAAGQRKRRPYRAIAAAFALHLAILAAFIARPGPVKRLGVEDGVPETLNVGIISAADLKRLSSDPFLQEAHPASAPATESEPSPKESQEAPEPEKPAAQEANAAASMQSKATETRDTPYDPSGFIEMAAAQFSSQLDHAFKAAEARRQPAQRSGKAQQPVMASRNVKVMRPGATHVGKSDEFARAVIWALEATKPMGNGKWGTTIVSFTVLASGQIEGPRLLKSADDNWLDTAALMAVRQARMPVPPPGLPAGDRTFNVEYISLQSR